MTKGLGITPKTKSNPVPEDEIKSQISSDSVELVEKEVNSVFDKRNDLNQRITELNAKKRNLELISAIPVDIELYSGYRSIFSVVGTGESTAKSSPPSRRRGTTSSLCSLKSLTGTRSLRRSPSTVSPRSRCLRA